MNAADQRRWAVLVTGMVAMAAGCAFQFGLPYLIPALRDEGLTLAQAGVLTAAPTAGLLVTLIAWGAAADRWGERWVMTAGLGAAGVILLAGSFAGASAGSFAGASGGPFAGSFAGASAGSFAGAPAGLAVCLFLAGAAAAAVNASSGRLILGWFSARERGLAMGLRQAALPLGVAIAALVLPGLDRHAALAVLGTFCLAAAALVAIVVRDPPAPRAAAAGEGSPYRGPVLWRIHAASALLVIPQLTVATYALVFLVDLHGWPPSAAGRMLAIGQAAGALARLVAGWWSDRAGSRLRPMRQLSLAIAAVLVALAAGVHSGFAVAALLAAGVITVSPNGLAFTAVAEHAGRGWAGRALGIQNTAQNVAAVAAAPGMAALITTAGYGTAFGIAVAFPLLAAAVIPAASSG